MKTWICTKFTWDTTNIKIKYKKVKKCSNTFGELPLTGVFRSGDSEIRKAIVRMAKTNAIFKHPVNKLSLSENTYQDSNQTGTAREQKWGREAAVIGKLKRKCECWLREHWGKESLNNANMNLTIRWKKAREIFPSVTRVWSILLSTSATSASVERANFKGRVA